MTCKRYNPVPFRILMAVYLFAVGYMCFASMDSFADIPKTFLGMPTDKVVHFCMFSPFVPLLYLSMGKKPGSTMELISRLVILASAGCIFAGLTEIIQGMLPYRCEDTKDFLADVIGIILVAIAVFIIASFRKRRHSG